eukprot:763185-Hanusia_phi.AAC.3
MLARVATDSSAAASSYDFYVTVDTSHCLFTGQPMYFASIHGNSNHWAVWTTADTEDPNGTPDTINKKSLRIWLRTNYATNLNEIAAVHWEIKWCGVGTVDVPAPSYALCCGKSSSSNWNNYGENGVTSVSFKGCGFTGTDGPYVFTSLSDTSGGISARVSGVNSIYGASNDGFTVYLMMLPGYSAIGAGGYNQRNFQLNWCAFQPRANEGSAGYPCTAPRLLAGAGGQNVQSDDGNMCCDKTKYSGWQDSGDGKTIYRNIDVSRCGFSVVTTVLVDLRGDWSTADKAGGTAAFSWVDSKTIRYTVWTNGQYRYYDAVKYHWRAQWCLMGQ